MVIDLPIVDIYGKGTRVPDQHKPCFNLVFDRVAPMPTFVTLPTPPAPSQVQHLYSNIFSTHIQISGSTFIQQFIFIQRLQCSRRRAM